jgi:hypothetical protein
VIVNGLTAKEALKLCDLTHTVPTSTVYSRVRKAREKGIHNKEIRREQQRKSLLIDVIEVDADSRASQDDDVSPLTATTTESSFSMEEAEENLDDGPSFPSSIKSGIKKMRKSFRQASVCRLDAKRVRLDYDGRYSKAWKDATILVASKDHKEPCEAVCNRLNKKFRLDRKNKQLKRSTVFQAVKDGRAGMSPKKRGPACAIPDTFLETVATHSEVCQVGDGELKGKDLKRLIGASILGTKYEDMFSVEGAWRKLRKDFPESFQASTNLSIEDARAQWTTHDNLNQWFEDAKKDLLRTGLVIDEEVLNQEGGIVSEIRFRQDTERRIINMDETHHDLSITGDRGGPRAVSYHNPALQRGARRKVKSARHVTGAYATNSAGEALPPFYIFDSCAKTSENFRVNVDWLVGLPSVTGRYGCPTLVESGSFYAVRPKGSMDDTLLNDYIERVIVPLYPNMHKTAVFDPVTGKLNQGPVILKLDAGPGRIVSSEEILFKREELFERGLIILMGLPNATSVQQEMDALYGPFKSATYRRGEKVIQNKLRIRGLARRDGAVIPKAVLNLDFIDLATIVNGNPEDNEYDKPFDLVFTKTKILRSWAKVGLVPFTRNCLNDKKVRKELGQHTEDETLENLQVKYDQLRTSTEADGFNPGIFDASIPTAAHVNRADTEEEQVEELLKAGKAFSASGQWNLCDSRIGNAGVTIRAQKRQLELNENARLKIVNKKNEAHSKMLERALIALEKYEFDAQSMNDKDWGDVIRWVLPAANVDFRLKDLKKKADILVKLATLPRCWTSYIPRPQQQQDVPAPVEAAPV